MIYFASMILLNLLATVGVYLAEAYTRFGQLEDYRKEQMIGILFGALACLTTELGPLENGAVTNVRDGMVVTAGLLFGGSAGVLAGVIGGAHRWLSVLWGGGAYTQVACSVSTIIAGYAAALLRRYFFRDSRPAGYYVAVFSVGVEAFHMLMIFLTHVNGLRRAFEVIQANAVPMILANSLSIVLAVGIYYLLDTRLMGKPVQHSFDMEKPAIPKRLVTGLVISITLVFMSVGGFVFFLQTRLSQISIYQVLESSTAEVVEYIDEQGYGNLQEDGQKILKGIRPYHVHLYSYGQMFLVDHDQKVYRPAEKAEEPLIFPMKTPEKTGRLYRAQYGEYDIFYVHRAVRDYYLVAAIPVSDTMLFRDITMYLLTFMIILLFSLLFFGSYVFLRNNITKNITSVTRAMMKLLDPDAELREIQWERSGFTTISGEINHSIQMLNYYCGDMVTQIQEEKGDLRKFQYQAEHDPMTGLYNRNGFERKLVNLEGLTINVAFLFIDVDLFKGINDSQGHDAGDLILKKVANEVRSNIRNVDIPVRLGGDEFALLMVGCSPRDRESILHKIQGINHRLQHPEDGLPPVSLSVGVAFSDTGYQETVVQNADAALYRAKAQGRCRCCFYGEDPQDADEHPDI